MRALTVGCVFLWAISVAAGQSTSALLNEALDKQVNLKLDTNLPLAMRQIADETGVRIEAGPAVWDLLPWGEQTRITATIQGKTLRESLRAITQKLGLRFELRENAVVIRPVPALARLGRRSTVQELALLDVLSSTPFRLEAAAGGTGRPTLRQVVEAVDAQLLTLKTEFVVENRAPQSPNGGGVQEALVPVGRGATLADALEAIGVTTNITWYPWGKSVVVLPKEDQIRSVLQKPITVRYDGVDVSQVLLELSKTTGVDFAIEPGAVQRIIPEFRTIRLIVDNASVQQVLENLAASTGLGYVVTDKSVYIWNNSPIPGAMPVPQQSGGPGRTSLLIPLGDGRQIVVPESEIPEDLKAYLKSKKAEEIQRLREQMKRDGFVPPEEKREDL